MKHNVNIECTDNGWLIKWTRNMTDNERARKHLDAYRQWGSPVVEPKLNGAEVFDDHERMVARVKELTS